MLGALIVTPERFNKMDFCYMSWTEPYTLIVPKVQEESRLFAFIRPFQPMVKITDTIFISLVNHDCYEGMAFPGCYCNRIYHVYNVLFFLDL